jgi:hypothetical protein
MQSPRGGESEAVSSADTRGLVPLPFLSPTLHCLPSLGQKHITRFIARLPPHSSFFRCLHLYSESCTMNSSHFASIAFPLRFRFRFFFFRSVVPEVCPLLPDSESRLRDREPSLSATFAPPFAQHCVHRTTSGAPSAQVWHCHFPTLSLSITL